MLKERTSNSTEEVGLTEVTELSADRLRVPTYGGKRRNWSLLAVCYCFLSYSSERERERERRFQQQRAQRKCVILIKISRGGRPKSDGSKRAGWHVSPFDARERVSGWRLALPSVTDRPHSQGAIDSRGARFKLRGTRSTVDECPWDSHEHSRFKCFIICCGIYFKNKRFFNFCTFQNPAATGSRLSRVSSLFLSTSFFFLLYFIVYTRSE